jgi:hypothetical protein
MGWYAQYYLCRKASEHSKWDDMHNTPCVARYQNTPNGMICTILLVSQGIRTQQMGWYAQYYLCRRHQNTANGMTCTILLVSQGIRTQHTGGHAQYYLCHKVSEHSTRDDMHNTTCVARYQNTANGTTCTIQLVLQGIRTQHTVWHAQYYLCRKVSQHSKRDDMHNITCVARYRNTAHGTTCTILLVSQGIRTQHTGQYAQNYSHLVSWTSVHWQLNKRLTVQSRLYATFFIPDCMLPQFHVSFSLG